ncbi:MAG: phosphopantothenoylcysteine decarboxylase, partial [Verrucomicrobiales bacterium]|nr:phosphopantothenoylcysteine decarboxylase [Verrucomicrobiales bacterium]
MKQVLLGVSGSIAAYKSADITSSLTKAGHSVTVVMSDEAKEFITPLTLQVLSKNPVFTSFHDEKQSWRPGHIELADRSDLILIAPATANTIAKFANGIADDPLSSIYLATQASVIIAPA